MPRMPLKSIRARTTALFVLSTAALLMLFCGGILWYARRSAYARTTRALDAVAADVRRELSSEGFTDLSELTEEGSTFAGEQVAFVLVSNDGHVLRQSQWHGPTWPRRNDGWRVKTVTTASGTLVIGLPWFRTEQALERYGWMLLQLSALVLGASAVGAWLVVGRALSPIGQLSRQARNASVEGMRVSLQAPSPDAEIEELVGTLNGLLMRLEEEAAARGRFYAATSHELRTPLQALSGHLELALMRPRTASEYVAAIEEARLQTGRLSQLVSDLLFLNRLENQQVAPQEETDLSMVCDDVLTSLMPMVESQRLSLNVDLPDSSSVLAVPTHLHVLIRNLLENAIRYTPEGGHVALRVIVAADVQLDLLNDAPLLEGVQLQRLFEPFYRLDVSRSSQAGGLGLGLAICKAIVNVNGWGIGLTHEAGRAHVHVEFGRQKGNGVD